MKRILILLALLFVPAGVNAEVTTVTQNDLVVTWYPIQEGITHFAYNISVQNLQDTNRNMDISTLISDTSFDLSRLRNVKFYEWKNTSAIVSVPTYENQSYDYTYVDNATGKNITETRWRMVRTGTAAKTTYALDWKSSKMQAFVKTASVYKERMGVMNVPKYASKAKDGTANGTKWFRLEFDAPIQKLASGWGSSGKVAFEIDGIEYHPWWNGSWARCRDITLTELNYADRIYEPIYINLTALTMSSADNEIRILDVGCNSDGNEVPRDIVSTDDSTWAYVLFQANVSKNQAVNYSVYYDNSGATAPSYSPDSNLDLDNTDRVIANEYYNISVTPNGLWTGKTQWNGSGTGTWDDNWTTVGVASDNNPNPSISDYQIIHSGDVAKKYNVKVTNAGTAFNVTYELYANFPYIYYNVTTINGSFGGSWESVLAFKYDHASGTTPYNSCVKRSDNSVLCEGSPPEPYVENFQPKWITWNRTLAAPKRQIHALVVSNESFKEGYFGDETYLSTNGHVWFESAGQPNGSMYLSIAINDTGWTPAEADVEYNRWNYPLTTSLNAEQTQPPPPPSYKRSIDVPGGVSKLMATAIWTGLYNISGVTVSLIDPSNTSYQEFGSNTTTRKKIIETIIPLPGLANYNITRYEGITKMSIASPAQGTWAFKVIDTNVTSFETDVEMS